MLGKKTQKLPCIDRLSRARAALGGFSGGRHTSSSAVLIAGDKAACLAAMLVASCRYDPCSRSKVSLSLQLQPATAGPSRRSC